MHPIILILILIIHSLFPLIRKKSWEQSSYNRHIEQDLPQPRHWVLNVHLWPISWAMVMPRSKPVSSAITQFQSLEQAPPSWATPRTCLFPSGNSKSNLCVSDRRAVKSTSVQETWREYWELWRFATLWCTTEGQRAAGQNRRVGLSYCPSRTRSWEKRWCWTTAGSLPAKNQERPWS